MDSVPDKITDALLCESPDIPALERELSILCNHDTGTAIELIRAAALRANSTNFPAIDHMELVHTEGCNLACTYCFEKDMLGPRRMSPDVARRAVDLLLDYSGDRPRLYISHFGGEPMINFSAVQMVTEYALEQAANLGKTVHFDMTSNGVLLTDEKVDYLSSRNIMVLLSVDGLAESHDRYRVDRKGRGTFEDVMKGMAILKDFQQWVGVKMTVMPETAAELCRNVIGLHELGVNQFIVGHATGIHWPRDCMTLYANQLRELKRWYLANKHPNLVIADLEDDGQEPGFFGCQAARNSISITVDGEVSPCSKILALNNRDILAKLGDVRYGLTHIQNRADLVGCGKLRQSAVSAGVAEQYLGGCFATNYTENNSLFIPNIQDHELAVLKRSACAGCSSRCGEV